MRLTLYGLVIGIAVLLGMVAVTVAYGHANGNHILIDEFNGGGNLHTTHVADSGHTWKLQQGGTDGRLSNGSVYIQADCNTGYQVQLLNTDGTPAQFSEGIMTMDMILFGSSTMQLRVLGVGGGLGFTWSGAGDQYIVSYAGQSIVLPSNYVRVQMFHLEGEQSLIITDLRTNTPNYYLGGNLTGLQPTGFELFGCGGTFLTTDVRIDSLHIEVPFVDVTPTPEAPPAPEPVEDPEPVNDDPIPGDDGVPLKDIEDLKARVYNLEVKTTTSQVTIDGMEITAQQQQSEIGSLQDENSRLNEELIEQRSLIEKLLKWVPFLDWLMDRFGDKADKDADKGKN